MCKYPNYGIRVLDKRDGTISVKFAGAYLGSLSSDKIGDGIGQYVIIPCGQCTECRVSKAREWSIRLMHEAALHDKCSFLTLTYDDYHLPQDGSLRYRDLQLFNKNLRRQLDYYYPGNKIRFFAVGEYGSKSFRPHFHEILFGEDFSFDRKEWKKSHGYSYYRSDFLERIWNNGFSVIGDVSYDSVNYVARYTLKKITGNIASFVYDGLEPEKAIMSRRPGIGHDFLLKYKGDIYNYDQVVLRNLKARPPAYYDKLYSEIHPEHFSVIKDNRSRKAAEFRNNLLNRFTVDGKYDSHQEENYYDAISARADEFVKRKKGYETL